MTASILLRYYSVSSKALLSLPVVRAGTARLPNHRFEVKYGLPARDGADFIFNGLEQKT